MPNRFLKGNKNIKIIQACEILINKKLSVETLLYNNLKIKILADAIFNKEQIEKFKHNNHILLNINKKDNELIIDPYLIGIPIYNYQHNNNNLVNSRNIIRLVESPLIL